MAIGTAAAIGIGLSAASAGMSFVQAGNQKKAQRQAEKDASLAMQAARQKLDVNFYDALSVQKEPYELEREALLAQGAQAIQAGVESERGAAATAGRIQMGMNEAQAGVRSAMGQELSDLEKLSAQEDSRLRDVGTQLDLEEVAGAQLAAANAQELGAQAMQQGMQGVVGMGQQVYEAMPLYQKSKSAKEFGKLQSDYASAAKSNKLGSQFMKDGTALPFQEAVKLMGNKTGGVGYGFDVSGVGGMESNVFQDYMTGQSYKNLRGMRRTGFSK